MPLTQLRPLSLGEILDGSFTLYRRHFATLVATALIPVAAMTIPWVLLMSQMNAKDPAAMLAAGGVMLLLVPVMIAVSGIAWGGLTHEASQAYLGEEVSVRDGVSKGLRRALPLFGAFMIAGILIYAGFFLLIVPGFLLMIMFFAVSQAVVVEGKGPIEALGRSRDLARGAWGKIFGTCFVIFLIAYLPSMALGVGAAFLIPGFIPTGGEPQAAGGGIFGFYALSSVISGLTMPFMMLGLTLLYYDRRVRTEALDLEIATRELSTAV